MFVNLLRASCGAALMVLAAGCASTSPHAAVAAPTPEQARSVKLFRADGGAATWSELVDAACRADVVFIGEHHGHPLGLASAAALFEDVLARAPRAALAMEFLERDEQLAIDDCLSGVTTFDQFLAAAGRTDGNFPPGHRAMFRAAQEAGRPVHAANAPRRYVRLARTEGFERLRELTDEQRRLVRIPDTLIGGAYREAFDRTMTPSGEHAPADADAPEFRERLDAVYRSQSVWDWTMAESVARALLAGERPVVHVVGAFHVGFHGGTVQALERQLPGVQALVVSFEMRWGDALHESDSGRADFVAYVGPQPGD